MPKRRHVLVRAKPAEPVTTLADRELVAAEHFVEGLIVRGEAERTAQGELPPGATHEIVECDPQDQPVKIERRRYSSV